jgi:hypothetical protein
MRYYNILCEKGDLYEIKGFTSLDWPRDEKESTSMIGYLYFKLGNGLINCLEFKI